MNYQEIEQQAMADDRDYDCITENHKLFSKLKRKYDKKKEIEAGLKFVKLSKIL